MVRAVERVESAGKKSAAWANSTISAGVAEPIAAFVCSVVGADWVCLEMSRCHKWVLGVQ